MIKIRNANGEVIAVPGLKGRAGKSAYEYAVEGGYQGTEQEFKDFLRNTTSIMSDHKVDPEAHLDIRTEVSDLKDKVDNISITGGDASGQIEEHNTNETAHNDIRELITQLQDELDNIPIPDVSDQINTHNNSTTSHDDIRQLINDLTTRLNALADSDDETLDQLSEIVAYIKSNKSLIESVTTTKVNVDDIIDNLISTATDKPLSANQGRILNEKIEDIETKSVTATYDEDTRILDIEFNVPVDGIIEDTLDSNNSYNALSANQGRVLDEKINSVQSVTNKAINETNDKINTLENDYVSKTNYSNKMQYDYFCHVQNIGLGAESGYWKFARITVNDEYANSPIDFGMSQRIGHGELSLLLSSSPSPELHEIYSFTKSGDIKPCYAVPLGNGVFELYVGVSNWESSSVTRLRMNPYVREKVNIEWLDEVTKELPTNAVVAVDKDAVVSITVPNVQGSGSATYSKIGKLVVAEFSAYKPFLGENQIIIPEGFRPKVVTSCVMEYFNTECGVCFVDLFADGRVDSYILDSLTSRTNNNKYAIYGTVTYVVD